MSTATGLAIGFNPDPKLAADAVFSAMQKANITSANAVILLLTEALTPHIKSATRAAATIAQTTQVIGCSTSGIFTEEAWVLDSPAAAAIVLGGNVGLGLHTTAASASSVLAIHSPNNIFQHSVSQDITKQFGGITGDANGQGHFAVWQNAKGENATQTPILIKNAQSATAVIHGLTMLSSPRKVGEVLQLDLMTSHQQSAYSDLLETWHQYVLKQARTAPIEIPTHTICVCHAKTKKQLIAGDFSLSNVISINEVDACVTLTEALTAGHYMCWAMRESIIDEQTLQTSIASLNAQLNTQRPNFGLLFSVLSRGPLSDGIDHELAMIKKALPDMPLLGFYGNGTIAHANHKNQLLSHSLVLNLFKSNPIL